VNRILSKDILEFYHFRER